MADSSVDHQRRKKATQSECKICGAPAIYSYCGVISCRPCNVFFRRHALQKKVSLKYGLTLKYISILFKAVLKCNFDCHCEVNVNTRHVCSYCRLAKCLSSGMNVEMIRPSRAKPSGKKKPNANAVQKTPTNLVQSHALGQVIV